jgi:hypothetical protein
MKAITLCVNRFDEETKTAFLDLYSKVDAKVHAPEPVPAPAPAKPITPAFDEEIPF